MKGLLLFLCLTLLIEGCIVHKPQSIELPEPVPASFLEEYDKPHAEYFVGQWWHIFHDEKLNALMREALRNNPDLQGAFARLEQADAIARINSAAQKPFLNADGSWSRERVPSFLGDAEGDNYRFSLSAQYEVDLWEKYKSRTHAASFDAAATREDLKTAYMILSARLADLYYLAVEQRAQLELTDSTIISFEDALKRVEFRYRHGLVPALDVYQARQNLARARAIRPVFESNLAVAEHALAVLMGGYPGKESAGSLAVLSSITENFSVGLPSELLARRPDVQAAMLRLKSSDERISSAIADRFPAFNLLASYGKSSTAFVTGDIVGVFWNLMMSVAQPFFDGGRRSAEVDRTRAVFRENLALYHRTVLTAFQEVEDALAKNRASEERVALIDHQIEASSNALRLSSFRYMEGLSDYLPVLAAQQSLFESRSSLLSARRQLIADRVQLARALGGDWMEEFIEERLNTENVEDKKQ